MSEGGSSLGNFFDDFVDLFFGAISAPVDIVVNSMHHKPTLSGMHEGPSSGGGSSAPAPAPAGPGHGH